MNNNERRVRWASIIADVMDENMTLYNRGDVNDLQFVLDMAQRDPDLYDPRKVTDVDLSAAWNYADTFFDAATEKYRNVDGIPWEEASELMIDTIARLRNGRNIEDPRVLRYARHR